MRVATADNSHMLRKDENGGSTNLTVKRVNWLRARIGSTVRTEACAIIPYLKSFVSRDTSIQPMRALSVRSALHLNSQPVSRVVTLGVAGVQVPNVLFSIHYSVFTLFNYYGKVM